MKGGASDFRHSTVAQRSVKAQIEEVQMAFGMHFTDIYPILRIELLQKEAGLKIHVTVIATRRCGTY